MDGVEGRGTTTFLFSDIEGSTRLWEFSPDQMAEALQRHDEIVTAAFELYGGVVFSVSGDAFGAAFTGVQNAVAAALKIQSNLSSEQWPEETPLSVRLGVHPGMAQQRDGNFFGPAVNRAARIMASASGGQTLLSAAAAELLKSDHHLVDLGLHYLKDLAEPEHIWQLGTGAFQAPRSTREASIVRLPEPTSPLVGRESDRQEIGSLVRRSSAVAVVGPGGIGKTLLALTVAIEAQSEYADGVVFTDLGDVTNDEGVGDAIAASIGLRQASESTIAETIVDWYRDKEALLVLDNCDAVVDGTSAMVTALTTGCPNLRLMVTIRRRIDHPYIVVHRLEALPATEAEELLADRIAATHTSLDLSSHREGIAALAARLDGVPLAIELAAARCRSLTPAQLVHRLETGPDLLSDADRPTRQRSVEATVESSVGELPVAQQLAFARCSVFFGEFDLEAAQAVLAEGVLDSPSVTDALLGLVDASLLLHLPSGSFRMLAPVRDVATKRRSPEDGSLVKHVDYFCGLARRIGAGLDGPEEGRWAEIARSQFPNLRVACERAIGAGAVEAAGEIVFGLWRHSFDRMQYELLRWCDDTLAVADDITTPRAVSACLAASTASFVHLGRFDELTAAIERLESLGEAAMPYLPVAYGMGAVALGNQEKAPEAFAMAQRTRSAAMAVGNPWFETMSSVFGRDFGSAISLCRQLQNPTLWSWFHLFRGFTYKDEGRSGAAESDFLQAEAFARQVGNAHALGAARSELGMVAAVAEGRSLLDTLTPLDQAIEIFERLRTPLQLWNSLEVLAQILARRNLLAPAQTIWAAIDAEHVRPASIGQRPNIEDPETAESAAARARGAVLDLWQTAEFARNTIRLATDGPVRGSRVTSSAAGP